MIKEGMGIIFFHSFSGGIEWSKKIIERVRFKAVDY